MITPSTRLRRTTRVPITHVQGHDEDGEPYLIAFHRDRELSVGAEWTGFLRNVLAAEEFVAEAACSWFEPEATPSWEDVRETLHALLVDGVIELA